VARVRSTTAQRITPEDEAFDAELADVKANGLATGD